MIAPILVLGQLGISVAPILGAAGVVGLAVGCGAQGLVKDFVTGFFLLPENQIRQGNVVQLGDHSGPVEEITLRLVRLRDYERNVHYVPNDQITTVANKARGFSNAVFVIGVAYREDLDEVMKLMRQVAAQLREDAGFEQRILADLDIAGVDRLDDSAVIIRCRIRCMAAEQWGGNANTCAASKQPLTSTALRFPSPT